MDDEDAVEGSSGWCGDVTRISAPVVQPLHCQVAEASHDPNQELVVVTLGDPAGMVFTLALLPDDVAHLRAQLLVAKVKINPQKRPTVGLKRVEPHSPKRAMQHLRKVGVEQYVQDLALQKPMLADYVEKQVASLATSYQRKSLSRRASGLFRHRLRQFILVAIDAARSDT